MPPAATWDAERFREEVGSTLADFVDGQYARLAPLGADAESLVDAAHEAVAGGKRFRAMFCCWGFRAVRAPRDDHESTAVVRAAAALELLHSSALVHDDYMDASDTRRGRPSAHQAFASRHRSAGWRGNPGQYGAAAAILLGDLLLSWSDELMRICGAEHDVVLDALGCLDLTRSEVIAGQFLDVSAQARGTSDVDHAMLVLRYKSAKYSVERPLHVGAALAGGSPATLEALSAYGLPLGEAFQLRDDLLGVFGDPDVTGKPAGDDLSEGKRTVLVALAVQRLPRAEAVALENALGRPLSGREVADLQRAIERSGAHEEVERRIAELTARSLSAIDRAEVTEEARSRLSALAAEATQRVV